jgi:hypothetical protein
VCKWHIYAALILTGIAATGIVTGVLAPVQHAIERFLLGE